jgi:hypothetical protein
MKKMLIVATILLIGSFPLPGGASPSAQQSCLGSA